MIRVILRRLILLIPVLVGITLVTFTLARVVPKNVAYVWAGPRVPGHARAAAQLTVSTISTRPSWSSTFTHGRSPPGRFGRSPVTTRPVISEIRQFLPHTIELAVGALLPPSCWGCPSA